MVHSSAILDLGVRRSFLECGGLTPLLPAATRIYLESGRRQAAADQSADSRGPRHGSRAGGSSRRTPKRWCGCAVSVRGKSPTCRLASLHLSGLRPAFDGHRP